MSDTQLKPCPFCGGEAETDRVGNLRQSHIVTCTDCGCRLESNETFNHGVSWNTRAAPKVKPLVWEHANDYLFLSELFIFGIIRVEKYGSGWQVNWSMPGFSGTFVEGEFDTADEAKTAAQADYERRILEALE